MPVAFGRLLCLTLCAVGPAAAVCTNCKDEPK